MGKPTPYSPCGLGLARVAVFSRMAAAKEVEVRDDRYGRSRFVVGWCGERHGFVWKNNTRKSIGESHGLPLEMMNQLFVSLFSDTPAWMIIDAYLKESIIELRHSHVCEVHEDSCHVRLDMSDALATSRNCTFDHFIIRGREATGPAFFGGFTDMMSPWNSSLEIFIKGDLRSNPMNN